MRELLSAIRGTSTNNWTLAVASLSSLPIAYVEMGVENRVLIIIIQEKFPFIQEGATHREKTN